jgi:hypothetical protein
LVPIASTNSTISMMMVVEQHVGFLVAQELTRVAVLEPVESDKRDEIARALDAFLARHAGELEREGNIVDDVAPGEGRFLLKHHADRLVRFGYRLAGDSDDALMMAEQSADDVEQCRLAAAGGPDDREEFTGLDLERDVINCGDWAFRRFIAHDNVVYHQDGIADAGCGDCHGQSLLRVMTAVMAVL